MAKSKKAERQRKLSSARARAEKRGSSGFTSLKLPQGLKLFKPPENGDEFEIDIVPYVIKERGANPYALDDDKEPLGAGELHWERTYFVHRNVGSDEKAGYVCPKKTFNKKCPICEHKASLIQEGGHDEQVIRGFNPQERQLFLVAPHTGDGKGEVQLWDVPYWNFGTYLDNRTKKYPTFADLEKGLTLEIAPKEKKFSGRKFWEFPSISFRKRDEGLDLDLDEVPCLDEIPKEIGYKELAAIFNEEEPVETEDKSQRKSDEEDDEDEEDEDKEEKEDEEETASDLGIKKGSMVKHKEYGECEVLHVSGDGTSLKIEDEDGDTHGAVSPSEVELVKDDDSDEEDDDEDEEPKPKPKGKKPKKTEADDADSDDDDDDDDSDIDDSDDDDDNGDDDEDEEPKPKPKKRK